MNTTARYRKRPVVVDAIRYWPGPGGNCEIVAEFIGDDSECDEPCDPETVWTIFTLEGEMQAQPGDWIVRGVDGEFYPVKPHIFRATYEPAED